MRPDFLTMDMEYADRVLPSICSLSILSWKDGEIIDIFTTLINPDCEIESFMKDRHGITDIEELLSNNIVFMHGAAHAFSSLLIRTDVDYLKIPNLVYGCTMSLSRRVWKGLNDYRLSSVTEKLDITKLHNNSLEDAKSVGQIVCKALDKRKAKNIFELFDEVGYAGGRIRDNKKEIYRAAKDKDEKIFLCNFKESRSRCRSLPFTTSSAAE